MYWHAKVVKLELIGHFTERLKTVLAFSLLKSIHLGRLVTFLRATYDNGIKKSNKRF